MPLESLRARFAASVRYARQIGTEQLIQIGLFAQINSHNSIPSESTERLDHGRLAHARTTLEHDGHVHHETTHDSQQIRRGRVRVETVDFAAR